MKDKIIKMVEIEVDLSEDIIEKIIEMAKKNIVNDRTALINYGVNKVLEEVIKTNGKCLNGKKLKCKK